MRVDGPDGHGDEPRQVHRLPHLLGDLQAGVDQPGRHRVRLVQQRRDPARAGLPAPLRGPGEVAGRLDAQPRGRLQLKAGGRLKKLLAHLRQPGPARARRLLRAVDLRLRDAGRRTARRRLPGGPAEVAHHRRGHEDHLVGQLGRQPRRRHRAGPPRPDRRAGAPRVRGQDQVRVRADVHVLPAADLRALPQPVVHGVLPVRRDLQARPRTASCSSTRTAAAAGGSASPAARTRRSTSTTRPARPRSARSATRGSRSACRRSARRPASAGCATSGCSCTTPTRSPRPRRCRTSRTSTRRSSTCCSTRTTRRCIAAAREQGIPDGLAGRRPPLTGLRAGQEVPGRAAAAPGVPHDADGLVRPAAVAGRRPAARAGPRRRGPRQPVRRHRGAADPGRVPRRAVHRRRHRRRRRRAAQARRDARLHARHHPRPRARRVDPRRRSA